MIQDIKRGPHMDDCPGVGCGGAVRTIESFEASEVSRNLITEMRERIAQLEAERDEWKDVLHSVYLAICGPAPMEPWAKIAGTDLLTRFTQLEAERDALAAALVKARDLAGTASCYEVDAALSTEAGSDVFGSPGIARKSLVKRAKNAWAEFDAIIDGDPTAILAARDKEKDEKIAALAAALEWLVGDHNAPSDCFSTGPITGTPKDDLCPACAAVRYLESGVISPALFAARDARMKREGKMEALRGLPPKHERLFGSLEYIRGWNGYREKVDAAIAALEQKGEQG